MDGYQGESLLVFATNHQFMLDSALWRRFDSITPFTLPKEQDRLLMLRLFFRAFAHSDDPLATLAKATNGASGSDIEWLVTEIMRRLLLDGRRQLEKRDMDDALANYRLRMETVSNMNPNPRAQPKARGERGWIQQECLVIDNILPCPNMANRSSAGSVRLFGSGAAARPAGRTAHA